MHIANVFVIWEMLPNEGKRALRPLWEVTVRRQDSMPVRKKSANAWNGALPHCMHLHAYTLEIDGNIPCWGFLQAPGGPERLVAEQARSSQ